MSTVHCGASSGPRRKRLERHTNPNSSGSAIAHRVTAFLGTRTSNDRMDFGGSHKEVRGRCPRSPAKQRRHGIATRERRSPRHFWGYFCAAAGQAFACHAQIRQRKTPQSVPADATRSWATSAEDSDPVHTSGSRSSSCGRAHDNQRVCSRHSHNSRPRSSGVIKGDMYGLRLAPGSTRAVYCLQRALAAVQ